MNMGAWGLVSARQLTSRWFQAPNLPDPLRNQLCQLKIVPTSSAPGKPQAVLNSWRGKSTNKTHGVKSISSHPRQRHGFFQHCLPVSTAQHLKTWALYSKRVHMPALPLYSCVTWNKLLNLSVSQFPLLKQDATVSYRQCMEIIELNLLQLFCLPELIYLFNEYCMNKSCHRGQTHLYNIDNKVSSFEPIMIYYRGDKNN